MTTEPLPIPWTPRPAPARVTPTPRARPRPVPTGAPTQPTRCAPCRREALQALCDLDDTEFTALVTAGQLLEVPVGPFFRYALADAAVEGGAA